MHYEDSLAKDGCGCVHGGGVPRMRYSIWIWRGPM
jgi:hypothetical protein